MTPLHGLKVLELARVLAGPWAGQVLADLGADVVKVEGPEGDETRNWGPPFAPDGAAAYYHSTNRGKRDVTADFRNADDLVMVKALAAEADVIIEIAQRAEHRLMTRFGAEQMANQFLGCRFTV